MADFVLSVWGAGDEPPEGAPFRLRRIGDTVPLATHAEGFDVSAFIHSGAPIEPQDALTAAGLMKKPLKVSVGQTLWDRVTPGDIGSALAPLVGTERIYLDLHGEKLLSYPWELLRYANQDIFTAPNARWCLGHPDSLDPTENPFAGKPTPIEHPLRVMVVLGNKPDDNKILAAEELHVIEREAHLRNADVLLLALHHPSTNDIEDKLKDFRPHVFHFIGHGGAVRTEAPQFLVYSAKARESEQWDADRVRNVFSQAPPRVVVLNACLTGHAPTDATSLMRAFFDAGCIATVAMMGEILGQASVEFSARLFSEIFAGQPLDVATTHARMAVGNISAGAEVKSNWALPRLMARGDVAGAVTMPFAAQPPVVRYLKPDFVARWQERWQSYKAMDGSYRGDNGTESRLVVLFGEKDAGKRELLNALAEIRCRTGEAVLFVDVSGSSTGTWRNLLKRIADQAAADGFDAAALQEAANSGGPSATVMTQFLDALEHLRRPAGGDEALLVVLDGLGDWTIEEVTQTVLPELCRPLLRAKAGSRLRMMITVQEPVQDETWGPRPRDWKPVAVGDFDRAEWARAVRHLRDYWAPQLAVEWQNRLNGLADFYVADSPTASNLVALRTYAQLKRS